MEKIIEAFFAKHKIITAIGALFIIGVIGSAMSNKNDTTSSDNNKTTVTADKKEESKSTTKTTSTESTAKKDNVPAEYKSALDKATSYANTMNMSKKGLFEQLTSDAGEKFTKEAAQYAIDHVQTDYKVNALKKAKTYQNDMKMSPAAIKEQLVSDAGEKFTPEEAQYAIDNLNK